LTTTNNTNPSHIKAPAPLSPATAGDLRAEALVTIWFRQSSDGVNFTVTPTYMGPQDAVPALSKFPWEMVR
jgi:hypothetical protein